MTRAIPDWATGQTVRLDDGRDWTVQAVTPNFAALTRTVDSGDLGWDEDNERVGEPLYTICDWRNGLRGPANVTGVYGSGTLSAEDFTQMLAEFEAGTLELSRRSQKPITVTADYYRIT